MTNDDRDCDLCSEEAIVSLDREPLPQTMELCTDHCFKLGVELVEAAALEDMPLDSQEPDVIEVAVGTKQ